MSAGHPHEKEGIIGAVNRTGHFHVYMKPFDAGHATGSELVGITGFHSSQPLDYFCRNNFRERCAHFVPPDQILMSFHRLIFALDSMVSVS